MFSCRCLECDAQFESDVDEDICMKCRRWERAGIEAARLATERHEPPPPKWTRAWKRARLGVNGNVDE